MKPDYIHYSTTALATDDAFIAWVLHGREDAGWAQWLETHPEMLDRVSQAAALVRTLTKQAAPAWGNADKHELWTRIEASARRAPPIATSRKILRARWWSLAAAAAALALVIWVTGIGRTGYEVAEIGEHREFVLPEDSRVALNAGSRLRYTARSFATRRQLDLEGEAFFQVRPGSTFTVQTPAGSVTVLGTSFNVFARDGQLAVHCYSGKVRVADAGGQAVEITAGQWTELTESGLATSGFEPEARHPAWTQGRFIFHNRPLREVIAELERQYDVRVEFSPSIGALSYTGLFESGDLKEALTLITWPLHITYTRDGKTIRLAQ